MIENLLKESNIDYSLVDNDKYAYNGLHIPRVTEILQLIHEEYLMIWANAIGFRRKRYQTERDNAAIVGTYVHELVEQYISSQVYKDLTYNDNEFYSKINNAVNSFKLWYNDVFTNNKIEVIGMEQPISCPWFGGTYDILLKINDKLYLGDFKTSNHISYKYFMQLAAYRYILKTQHNINIDGVLILQLDKKIPSYEEYFLDFNNQEHLTFINQCETTFLSTVYLYFNRLKTMQMYNDIFKKRR